jgi:hypothetical protein
MALNLRSGSIEYVLMNIKDEIYLRVEKLYSTYFDIAF